MKLTEKEKMREIKFRGEILNANCWVYGFYFYSEKENKHYIIGESIDYGYQKIEIDPKTKGQFIGLHDKTGAEIYEADIVKMHYFFDNFAPYTLGAYEDEKEIIGVVGIDEMGTYTVCDDDKYYWLNYMEYPQEELEIIGNIYDNPELLKKQE